MMRPDINIAIAYSGQHQTKVAEMLRHKLQTYIDAGYPVSVSLVREKLDEIGRNFATRQDNKDKAVRIAEAMENYFSDFDCAIFLFDINGKAMPIKGNPAPLISSNLIYEYGLASSSFINKAIGNVNNKDKKIYCFSPSEINTETLKYIRGIDLIRYDKDFGEYGENEDTQTEFIINHFIHKHIILNAGFYGLPEKLPTLTVQNGKYVLYSSLGIRDLMETSNDNNYWPDLKKLQPGGVRVALDSDASALSEAFKVEYKRFEKTANPSSEHVMARRIMYIVDRAVFIMYLREESEWKKYVEVLKSERENVIGKTNKNLTDDYYWLVLNGLCAVFDYQSYMHLKTLYEGNKLEHILEALNPIISKYSDVGNKMVYCLLADYMALAYHKMATRELKGALLHEFYLDNFNHIEELRHYVQSNPDSEKIKSVINNLGHAITLFSSVVETSNNIQVTGSKRDYIWQSYALYNQARCEFLLHLLDVFVHHDDHSPNNMIALLDTQRLYFDDWNKHLLSSVYSRRDDYRKFKQIPLFPQILRFNLKAEFYHAEFEYELACLVDNFFNASNSAKSGDEFDFEHKKQGFKKWKDENLTITDVLSVDGKVSRIDSLNSIIIEKEIKDVFSAMVESLHLTKSKEKALLNSLFECAPIVKKAMLTRDTNDFYDAKNKIESVKSHYKNINLNFDIAKFAELIINTFSQVTIFVIKLFNETSAGN